GYGIEDPETGVRRAFRDADDALDGLATAFGKSAHAFFFNGGEAPGEVAGRDRILAHGLAVVERFVVSRAELLGRLGRGGARNHEIAQADHFDHLFKNGRAAEIDETVKRAAYDGIAGEAGGSIRSAAL